MTKNEIIGREVRRLRTARCWKIGTLARAIGVSVPHVSDMEHGRRGTTERLAQIAAVLGVAQEHFLTLPGICQACRGTGLT